MRISKLRAGGYAHPTTVFPRATVFDTVSEMSMRWNGCEMWMTFHSKRGEDAPGLQRP